MELANTNRDDLKGYGKLTEQEYSQLGSIRAGIQNDLGDMDELLEKNGLRYDSRFGVE